MKSICKISYYYNNKPNFGTGFFMKFSDSLKLLITNYHVIFPDLKNINIQIEIWNKIKMILNLKGRYIRFMKLPKDITAIEIKETDEIYKYIQFLNMILIIIIMDIIYIIMLLYFQLNILLEKMLLLKVVK